MLEVEKNNGWIYGVFAYVFVCVIVAFLSGCATTQAAPMPTTNDLERGYDPSWKPDTDNLDYFFNAISSAAGAVTILSFF